MTPTKFATPSPSPQMLIHDTTTAEEAKRILEQDVLPAIEQELDRSAAELAERTGLPKHLIRLSLAHRLSYAARALEKVEASRARHDGASQADIARATGRNPSNVRRVYPQLDDLVKRMQSGIRELIVDGFTFSR
jgi:hypothetical protein